MNERKEFVELRLFIADPDQRPADLSRVTGSVVLTPKSGAPVEKDFQLMMPDPPQGVPASDPRVLSDGHLVRAAVVRPDGPFRWDKPGPGMPSVYLKADLPAEAAEKDATATVTLKFPSGKEKLDLGALFPK
jgi:hypothetical protein